MQVILKGDHLLQLHMARESSYVTLQYPTRYLAGDIISLEIDIRLNRYTAQAQVIIFGSYAIAQPCLRVESYATAQP